MILLLNRNTGELLTAISADGLHAGEVESTAELIAYEKDIEASEIIIKTIPRNASENCMTCHPRSYDLSEMTFAGEIERVDNAGVEDYEILYSCDHCGDKHFVFESNLRAVIRS